VSFRLLLLDGILLLFGCQGADGAIVGHVGETAGDQIVRSCVSSMVKEISSTLQQQVPAKAC
jgi:hypothetical protein